MIKKIVSLIAVVVLVVSMISPSFVHADDYNSLFEQLSVEQLQGLAVLGNAMALNYSVGNNIPIATSSQSKIEEIGDWLYNIGSRAFNRVVDATHWTLDQARDILGINQYNSLHPAELRTNMRFDGETLRQLVGNRFQRYNSFAVTSDVEPPTPTPSPTPTPGEESDISVLPLLSGALPQSTDVIIYQTNPNPYPASNSYTYVMGNYLFTSNVTNNYPIYSGGVRYSRGGFYCLDNDLLRSGYIDNAYYLSNRTYDQYSGSYYRFGLPGETFKIYPKLAILVNSNDWSGVDPSNDYNDRGYVSYRTLNFGYNASTSSYVDNVRLASDITTPFNLKGAEFYMDYNDSMMMGGSVYARSSGFVLDDSDNVYVELASWVYDALDYSFSINISQQSLDYKTDIINQFPDFVRNADVYYGTSWDDCELILSSNGGGSLPTPTPDPSPTPDPYDPIEGLILTPGDPVIINMPGNLEINLYQIYVYLINNIIIGEPFSFDPGDIPLAFPGGTVSTVPVDALPTSVPTMIPYDPGIEEFPSGIPSFDDSFDDDSGAGLWSHRLTNQSFETTADSNSKHLVKSSLSRSVMAAPVEDIDEGNASPTEVATELITGTKIFLGPVGKYIFYIITLGVVTSLVVKLIHG